MTVAFKKSLVWLVLCVCLFGATTTSVVRADDEASPPPKQDESTTNGNTDGAQKVEHRASRPLAKEIPVDTFDVKSHFDWGTYYDPKKRLLRKV